MKPAFLAVCVFSFFCAIVGQANPATAPDVVSLGNDTYSVTREASSGLSRNTDKLKELALDAAKTHCAKLNRELKIVSVTAQHPKIPLTGFASATVVFKALPANDPALSAPAPASADAAVGSTAGAVAAPSVSAAIATPATPVDPLYYGLLKLDDLHKRGLLTDEEFQAQRKALVEKSK